jgi:hypothetical protein
MKNFKSLIKSRCQGKPHKLESGGSADHLGTNFFRFPMSKNNWELFIL